MDYECPECGNKDKPKIIIRFPPQIFQCVECGKKGNEKDFIKKNNHHRFTPVPKFPS
ncbi:MAG: hypothetical protein ACFFAN_07380 [Promethearchaeota archaeon]